MIHPPLTGRAHRVEIRAPNRAEVSTESEGLHHVGPAPDPAIADDRESISDRLADRFDQRDRRRRIVELTTAVIGESDPIDTRVASPNRVVDTLDPLQHDRAVPDAAQPVDVTP